MENFYFYLDQKVTTWYRTSFEVKANTIDEAKQIAIGFVKEGKTSELPWDSIDDTIEVLPLKENGGQPTEELYLDSGDVIWDNTELS